MREAPSLYAGRGVPKQQRKHSTKHHNPKSMRKHASTVAIVIEVTVPQRVFPSRSFLMVLSWSHSRTLRVFNPPSGGTI